jgi:hypothetical protein
MSDSIAGFARRVIAAVAERMDAKQDAFFSFPLFLSLASFASLCN